MPSCRFFASSRAKVSVFCDFLSYPPKISTIGREVIVKRILRFYLLYRQTAEIYTFIVAFLKRMWYNELKAVILLNKNLKLHIKKLQRRSIISFITTLFTVFSIGLGILFLTVPSFIAIIFFAVAAFGIIYLIYSDRATKNEAKENVYKPVIFNANATFSFEKIITVFENLTDNENRISTSENVRFFRLNKDFQLRAVVYKTDSFNKKDFDNAKDRINKKANKELNISQWVRGETRNMMRFNIICTDVLNDALSMLVSRNAYRNLTRVEGIINIAIVGDKVIIPPLYGSCKIIEINRYKDVINFIDQFLLNA